MKVIIFASLLAIASAGFVGPHGAGAFYGGYGHGAAVAEAGHSNQHRSQDLAGNYKFGYNEQHTSGGSFRQESGDAWGNKAGSYGLRDADGRVRVVKYVADGAGFRAHISTNEPGTAASAPAAASYNGGHAKVAVAAAVPVAAYAAAPVAAYAAAPFAHYGGYGPVAAYGGAVAHYAAPAFGAYGAYGGHGAYGAHKYLG
ncbi:cuticle protein 14-like [Ornithodoros turicata]|uniref:cuticle protein 14-like n=1 Tax=Ornithodoros turicata TaxID=34597 RepID=UPI00313A3C5F